jgi:uncharacterized damage-inducible protein DinB
LNRALPVSIAGLIDMLRYARGTTVKAVEGLTVAELDHRFDEQSNSIGALLWHIAAVEAWYQTNTFDGRDWNADEEAKWLDGVELRPGIESHPLEHYLDALATVRARTERELALRDEEWLLRVEPFDETEANNYWKWFHVCEDEISHRGQIRWLRKRLPR